jgi:hypothetical protein
VPKGAPPVGSGSQDPNPARGGPRDKEVPGSQLPEPTLSHEPHVGSQLLKDATGPEDQDATRSQLPEAASGPEGQESSGPEPMKVDAPDPHGRVQSVQLSVYYISEVLHDAKTRYLKVHKLLYAVLIASRKPCHC